MNKLTKVGVSALCGSLATVSAANAGDMEVLGSSTFTYVSNVAKDVGNPLGMNTGLTFKGSGELDNGSTFSVSVVNTDQNAYSSANITFTTTSFGELKLSMAEGGNGIDGYDDKAPTAWEEVTGTGVGVGSDQVSGVGLSTSLQWASPTVLGTTLKLAYAPRNDGKQNNDKAGTGANVQNQHQTGAGKDIVLDINPTFDMFGFNLFAGYSITEDVEGAEKDGTAVSTDHEEGTAGVILTIGPVKAGFQRTAEFTGTRVPGNVDYYANTMWGVSFNVNDDLSISYGSYESDKGYHGKSVDTSNNQTWDTSRDMDTIEATSWQIAYTMGGASLKYANTDVDNAQYVTGTANDQEGQTLALTLAF